MAVPTNSMAVIKFMSFNSRGFNDAKQLYMTHLLSLCDVLYVQEHWLSDFQLVMLNGLSSVHGFGCKDVLSGRPYGGCAIFGRRDAGLIYDGW